ncbi:hypothetical protein [Bacillus sp. FSL R7-0685]|uniref:hypothetical protein n=1 Tax=Bacillus sp. FSL R7-0685 TaxID=2921589 RepID=UPI0030FA6F7F
MTKEDVLDKVERIRKSSGDNEIAHSMEDVLYLDVLKEIALGAENGRELAEAALEASNIDFDRWYA